MSETIKDNIGSIIILAISLTCFGFVSISLFEDISSSKERFYSHKDVICSGMVVLSGSGYVYKDVNTYTLAGKTYQMKDGETCEINDSYKEK